MTLPTSPYMTVPTSLCVTVPHSPTSLPVEVGA
jgi:hypothetical protein